EKALLKTEYGLLWWHDEWRSQHYMSESYQLFADALRKKNSNYLNLKQIKDDFRQDIKYLEVYNKYLRLAADCDMKLTYDKECFSLDGHKFQSLKEVEKALKLRAFL